MDATRALPRSVRLAIGWLLVTAAVVLAVGAVAAYGEYPSELSTPFSTVLAISSLMCLGLGILAFGFPRGPMTRPSPSLAAVVGLFVGLINGVLFVVLVGANVSFTRDTTIPAVARWLPVAVGAAAAVLGLVGLVTGRGDGRSRRLSYAALLLGIAPAITAAWLATSYCRLFVDRATFCPTP